MGSSKDRQVTANATAVCGLVATTSSMTSLRSSSMSNIRCGMARKMEEKYHGRERWGKNCPGRVPPRGGGNCQTVRIPASIPPQLPLTLTEVDLPLMVYPPFSPRFGRQPQVQRMKSVTGDSEPNAGNSRFRPYPWGEKKRCTLLSKIVRRGSLCRS